MFRRPDEHARRHGSRQRPLKIGASSADALSVANELPNTPAWVPAAPAEPPPPRPAAAAPSSTEILAATIAGAVERQLTQYMSVMSQQVEATRHSAEEARLEMR